MRPPLEDPQHPAAVKAARLFRQQHIATLCTASQAYEGWPFASLCPYALDPAGHPVIYIADIAQHTYNIQKDKRVSLMARESFAPAEGTGEIKPKVDPQAHGRITWMGRAIPIPTDSPEESVVNGRYLAKIPDASRYRRTHGFAYYRIEPEVIRFIGGFGEIYWIAAQTLLLDPNKDPLIDSAAGIIEHMNDDHVDSMELLCQAHYQLRAQDPKMVHIDQFGFDVQGQLSPEDDRFEAKGPFRLRFEFSAPATPQNVRERVVELVRGARAQLSAPSQ